MVIVVTEFQYCLIKTYNNFYEDYFRIKVKFFLLRSDCLYNNCVVFYKNVSGLCKRSLNFWVLEMKDSKIIRKGRLFLSEDV